MHSDPDNPPEPARNTQQTLGVWRDTLLIVTLSVFGLFVGSGFMIPLVLAILVFVLITAVSDRSRELWPFAFALPVWLANLTGAIVVLSGVFAVMYVLGLRWPFPISRPSWILPSPGLPPWPAPPLPRP